VHVPEASNSDISENANKIHDEALQNNDEILNLANLSNFDRETRSRPLSSSRQGGSTFRLVAVGNESRAWGVTRFAAILGHLRPYLCDCGICRGSQTDGE
jgi:hypothetical protein